MFDGSFCVLLRESNKFLEVKFVSGQKLVIVMYNFRTCQRAKLKWTGSLIYSHCDIDALDVLHPPVCLQEFSTAD